jgi:hypothetical protein
MKRDQSNLKRFKQKSRNEGLGAIDEHSLTSSNMVLRSKVVLIGGMKGLVEATFTGSMKNVTAEWLEMRWVAVTSSLFI